MANSGKLVSIWNAPTSTWKTFGEKWNDVNFPNEIVRTPSSYKGYSTTSVDSARNSDGIVVGDVVIEDVAKIEITWNFLTLEEFAKLSQLFLTKYNGTFFVAVSFFNETTGNFEGDNTIAPNTTTNVIRVFYPNDRVAEFAKLKLNDNGKPVGYENVSLHLVDTGRKYLID